MMDDFHNLGTSIKEIEDKLDGMRGNTSSLAAGISENSDALERLKKRVNALLETSGADIRIEYDTCTLDDLNSTLANRLADFNSLTVSDKALRMSPVDYVVAALAGGIAVVVDFLVVKIPKTGKYLGMFEQEGSPLTALFRKIGLNKDGKEAKWIGTLEGWFHVNYDPSIREGVFGPRNHRDYSAGHDPSPSGLVFAVKDILSGTFTYFDKSGRLIIEKAEEMGLLQKCFAPFMWFGHLLSDLFTSAGVPVPGGTLLRAIQVGEFGKKGRTFGELIDWMYMNGYDMRHLATMSTSNAAMNLIIGLYLAFINPIEKSSTPLLSEREYVEVKKNEKKTNLKFVASSVAIAGNITKICAYQGNPNAFNYTLWYEMIKMSISEVVILTKDKTAEMVIEARHVIDDSFEHLQKWHSNDQ